MNYVLKTILNSEGTLKTEETMTLRTLFKSEGTEKEREEKNSSSAQAKGGRREKSSLITQENFWCQ
jgi:hypothetical protein